MVIATAAIKHRIATGRAIPAMAPGDRVPPLPLLPELLIGRAVDEPLTGVEHRLGEAEHVGEIEAIEAAEAGAEAATLANSRR